MDIRKVGDHECINCGQCISACPTKAIHWKGSKLLLHKSAVDEKAELEKPIDLTAKTKISLAATNETVETAAPETTVTPEEAKTETPIAETAAAKVETPKKKQRGAAFWVQLAAWMTALIVLIGALVFYNFIDVEKPDDGGDAQTGYAVGQLAPDFTVELYGSNESFTLYDNRGKLTVINFWATWCTPCVNEIPYFIELTEKKPDINVIAIHGSSTRNVEKFIADKWGAPALTFAQDNLDGKDCLTYLLLGGKGTWPMTVIVDENGYVLYNSTNSFHSYEELETLIDGYMDK